jgi:hypothetical protein
MDRKSRTVHRLDAHGRSIQPILEIPDALPANVAISCFAALMTEIGDRPDHYEAKWWRAPDLSEASSLLP